MKPDQKSMLIVISGNNLDGSTRNADDSLTVSSEKQEKRENIPG